MKVTSCIISQNELAQNLCRKYPGFGYKHLSNVLVDTSAGRHSVAVVSTAASQLEGRGFENKWTEISATTKITLKQRRKDDYNPNGLRVC